MFVFRAPSSRFPITGYMYTVSCPFPSTLTFRPRTTKSLIASGSLLGFPQLVHLGHALLELVVLALFVAVSLVL